MIGICLCAAQQGQHAEVACGHPCLARGPRHGQSMPRGAIDYSKVSSPTQGASWSDHWIGLHQPTQYMRRRIVRLGRACYEERGCPIDVGGGTGCYVERPTTWWIWQSRTASPRSESAVVRGSSHAHALCILSDRSLKRLHGYSGFG